MSDYGLPTRNFPFEPSDFGTFELVERLGDDPATVADLVGSVAYHLEGGPAPARPYWQTPRMGRACYLWPENDEKFLVGVKGSGPGRSSDLLRAHWDSRNRRIYAKHGTFGGCVRLASQPPYLVLYQRDDTNREYELVQAVPEGLSSFSSALRDFVISRVVYQAKDISSARSSVLLRVPPRRPGRALKPTSRCVLG